MAASTIFGLICRISSRDDAGTKRSCFARIYRIGTATRRNSPRTSQPSTSLRRPDKAFGCTDETAALTAATNVSGASLPTRNCLAAVSENLIRNKIGVSSEQTLRRQPRTGQVANPAQSTSPFRFGGHDAAHQMASGVENDSATSKNGDGPFVYSPIFNGATAFTARRPARVG